MYKEKRWETVTDEEFEDYLKQEFIGNPKYSKERKFYLYFFIFFNVLAIISLILFFVLRKSYIIRQRNFPLTFSGGVICYMSIFISFLPQLMKTTCLMNVFQANILNTIAICIFFSRSLRIILFYRYNIYKVTSIKKKSLNRTYNKTTQEIEPNYYIPRITKKINKIISAIVIIPTAICIIYIIVVLILNERVRDECWNLEPKDALNYLKHNKGKELFVIIMIYSMIYMVASIINAIALYFVKDANKYGVKFECFTVSVLLIIMNSINIALQRGASAESFLKSGHRYKFYLDLFEITKGGRMLFTFVTIYMFFMSITLPVIQYYNSKKVKNEYFQDPMSSLQYFYKVLNTPSLVNELREIAVQEFSVENVLFWENYQILQTMAYRYHLELRKAEEMGDPTIVSQYDFEGYYLKQVQSFSASSMEDYSYDSFMPVPDELLPYYKLFYNMFIDYNGPASVNIMGSTVKDISNQISSFPTIGMYDAAKDEVVELMYSSIYPILLRNNKKHMANTLG